MPQEQIKTKRKKRERGLCRVGLKDFKLTRIDCLGRGLGTLGLIKKQGSKQDLHIYYD